LTPAIITVEIYPLPIAEFKTRILDLYRPPLRAGGTFNTMRRALDLLMEVGGLETTADITTAAIARFVGARAGRESPNSTRHWLGCIRAACSIAAAEGWMRISPFAVRKSWVRAVTPRSPRVHSRAEIARILATATAEADAARGPDRFRANRLRAAVATAAYSGMRRSEILLLHATDVDFAARMIFLTARAGADGQLKTDAAAQPVPLADALADILRPWVAFLSGCRIDPAADTARPVVSWLNVRGPKPPDAPTAGRPGATPARGLPPWVAAGGTPAAPVRWLFPNVTGVGPWNDGSWGSKPVNELKALGLRAGVPGVTWQSFRHSWASHAEFWGFSDTLIMRVLRHTSTRTQRGYRHAELNNLRELVCGIDFGTAAAEGGAT
jgi:integrase